MSDEDTSVLADSPEPPPVLSAERVVVERDEKRILRNVSIELRAGTVTGLLGPSGAGKSTLFRVLVGEDHDHEGRVRLQGRDVTDEPLHVRARRGLGYMPQGPSVLWDLSAIIVSTARTGLAKSWKGALHLTPGATMGGHAVRHAIERAGVDPAHAARLGNLLAALANDGVAVVLADHHVEEALRICTEAILLLDGAVVTSGSPEEFREHEVVRGRYLGTLSSHGPAS